MDKALAKKRTHHQHRLGGLKAEKYAHCSRKATITIYDYEVIQATFIG